LTARGWVMVLATLVAVGFAWLFGARALNAIVVPAVVGLVAAFAQVVIAGEPTVERTPPEPGFPGDIGTATLRVDGGSTIVDVAETVPEDLVVEETERTVAPPGELTYTIGYRSVEGPREYVARGVYELGPATVTVRDIFGLVKREVTCGDTDECVVYPQVYALTDTSPLSSLLQEARTSDREEFDEVREYVPGDPMRDIHWKSSAKQDGDLIVKEFAGREPDASVVIAVTVEPDQADVTATAAATVAVALLKAGLTITVVLPETRLRVGATDDRTDLFRALAETTTGQVDAEEWDRADITVSAANGAATVSVGNHSVEFEHLHETAPYRPTDAGGASQEVSAR